MDMQLLGCLQIDPLTVQLTVLERWRSWRLFTTTRTSSYVLAICVERWLELENQRYVLRPDPRHMRLCELWAGERINQKFNRATGLPVDAPLLDS